MTQLSGVCARLQDASDLAATLAAAYDAFETMLPALQEQEERLDAMFAAFVLSATAAADGRDAIAAAPSLPAPGPVTGAGPADAAAAAGAAEVTGELAALSRMLVSRLTRAAIAAPDRADRAACAEAARFAGQICALLTGAVP